MTTDNKAIDWSEAIAILDDEKLKLLSDLFAFASDTLKEKNAEITNLKDDFKRLEDENKNYSITIKELSAINDRLRGSYKHLTCKHIAIYIKGKTICKTCGKELKAVWVVKSDT